MKARCKESKSEHREEWIYKENEWMRNNTRQLKMNTHKVSWIAKDNVEGVIEEILVMGYCKSNLPI